jgi:hypothetical protein
VKVVKDCFGECLEVRVEGAVFNEFEMSEGLF